MTDIVQVATQARAKLTAPGAPFEIVEHRDGEQSIRLYRKAFPSLPAFIASARVHGDKPFIEYGGDTWSFNRFFAEADALAAQFEAWGVKPGERVALALRNRPEWATAFVAAAMLGAVPAPVNSFGLENELRAALVDVDPAVVVCDVERLQRLRGDLGVPACRLVLAGEGSVEGASCVRYDGIVARPAAARAVPELAPGDPALILFTSGATSRAKGVLSSQRAVCQALFNIDFIGAHAAMCSPEAVAALIARGLPPTTLTAVPLFHVSGLHAQLLASLRGGRRLVFMHRWSAAQAIDLIREHKVTQFNGAPSMVAQLMAEPRFGDDNFTASLAGLGFGGAGLPQRLIDEVLVQRPNSLSGVGFGLTETNGVGAGGSGRMFAYKPRSAGLLSPIVDVRIVGEAGEPRPCGEAGEIWLRGPSVMEGYWRNDEATTAALADGWFRSGDVGYIDEEGFLFVVDRIKDVINRAGEKIAAAEVESCVLELPEVLEAAVFAVPDDGTGEAVAAVVSVREHATLDAEAVRAHVGTRLAAYKVPAMVQIVSQALPRNPAGKLLKGQLRSAFVAASRG